MFYSVSWTQYFTFIVFAVVIYYLVIAYKYFKWELLSLVGIQRNTGTDFFDGPLPSYVQTTNNNEVGDSDISSVVQAFTDEAAAYADEALVTQHSPSGMLDVLARIVLKYPMLNSEENKLVRNDIILQEVAVRFPNRLRNEDFKKLP